MNNPVPRADILLCISTNQQITNLLAAVACGARKLMVLETAVAQRSGWALNLCEALRGQDQAIKVQCLAVPPAHEPDPATVARALMQEVTAVLQATPGVRLAFAWGGGQKPLATGVWQAFCQLVNTVPDAGHSAIYAEVHSGNLLCWLNPEVAPASYPIPLVSLDVRLRSFGIKKTETAKARLLWQVSTGLAVPLTPKAVQLPEWLPQVYDLYINDQDFRRLCFDYAGASSGEEDAAAKTSRDLNEMPREAIIQYWESILTPALFSGAMSLALDSLTSGLPKAISEDLSLPLKNYLAKELPGRLRNQLLTLANQAAKQMKTLPIPKSPACRRWLQQCAPALKLDQPAAITELKLTPDGLRFAELFELLLAWRTVLWINANPQRVAVAMLNLECRRDSAKKEVLAEFDITLLSNTGKLVVIDAKSFAVDNQKMRSQVANSQTAGGAAASFRFCFPMFKADCGSPNTEVDRALWGTEPWYPQKLKNQIAKLKGDERAGHKSELQIIPFDETDSFETLLDQLLK